MVKLIIMILVSALQLAFT